jgi:16S rRNA (cytidine1402-2'-O)-methyltransferase
VRPIPGVSSIMAALMISGLDLDGFLYYGFLSANRSKRIYEIKGLPDRYDVVFLETPYRMPQLIKDMIKIKGAGRRGMIAYKLTMPEEKVFRGSLSELKKMTENLPKGEFVFILEKQKKFR